MKASFVRRSTGLALNISAADPAEMLLLELFLVQLNTRPPLWIPTSGSRHGNSGEVVERSLMIEVAGPEVAFGAPVEKP